MCKYIRSITKFLPLALDDTDNGVISVLLLKFVIEVGNMHFYNNIQFAAQQLTVHNL